MYQIIKNGKVEKWVAVKGGKLVEVDSFNTYSEANNARERMEEVRGGFFEIVEKSLDKPTGMCYYNTRGRKERK